MFKYFVIKHSCVRSNAKTCKDDIVKTFLSHISLLIGHLKTR